MIYANILYSRYYIGVDKMAYIAPNSTIQLFKDIRLSPDSEDTFYFDNKSVQNTFFTQHVYATFNFNSYTRLKRNTIKIAGVMVNLYNCNYMRFINTSFENKWFYAFVTKVDYVNNETVEIDYIIDEVQTWLFSPDVSFEECYIDRQHDRNDFYFGNLINENLNIGQEYQEEGTPEVVNFTTTEMYAGFISSTKVDGTQPTTYIKSNVFMPLAIYGGPISNIKNILDLANNPSYTAFQPDSVIAVYMYPAFMGVMDDETQSYIIPSYGFKVTPLLKHIGATTNEDIDGYTPRNKKLFSYPYKLLTISNNSGEVSEYKWEGWCVNKSWSNIDDATAISGLSNLLGRFTYQGTPLPPVTTLLYPTEYYGIANDYDRGISINNFPMCAWNTDVFAAWWAQNKASISTGLISSAIGDITRIANATNMPDYGAYTGSLLGHAYHQFGIQSSYANAYGNTLSNILNTIGKMEDIKSIPPQVHGQILSDTLNAGMKKIGYTAKKMCIKREYAERIDNYFDLYGYKQNKLAYPDLTARENWCYIKTIGCNIHGNLPSDSMTTITDKFNSGIRFWKNPLRVGDYSMTNLPMGYQP
jgi:hypothetical protein